MGHYEKPKINFMTPFIVSKVDIANDIKVKPLETRMIPCKSALIEYIFMKF